MGSLHKINELQQYNSKYSLCCLVACHSVYQFVSSNVTWPLIITFVVVGNRLCHYYYIIINYCTQTQRYTSEMYEYKVPILTSLGTKYGLSVSSRSLSSGTCLTNSRTAAARPPRCVTSGVTPIKELGNRCNQFWPSRQSPVKQCRWMR